MDYLDNEEIRETAGTEETEQVRDLPEAEAVAGPELNTPEACEEPDYGVDSEPDEGEEKEELNLLMTRRQMQTIRRSAALWSKTWVKVLAVVVAVAVLAGTSGLTAVLVNNRWEAETQLMNQQFDEKLRGLGAKIECVSSQREARKFTLMTG